MLDVCLAIPVSSVFDLLKYWRGTHLLIENLAILINGSNLSKHWREAHKLDACPAILISGSNLLKH